MELPSNGRFPVSIDPKYQQIVVCSDILTISTIKFLTTTIPTLKHSTATPIANENRETVWDALRPTLLKYQAAGCVISEFRGGGEFKCLKEVILAQGVNEVLVDEDVNEQNGARNNKHVVGAVNVTSRDEHEPHIERFHRTLEERVRCLLCAFVNRYELKQNFRFPKKIIIGAVNFSILMVNAIILESGISNTLSPGALFDDIYLDYNVHCRLRFLQYVQMHHETTNTITRRASAALNLGPTGDRQGNHHFYDIGTNRVVERLIDKHTPVPMPEDIPAKLHKIGVREKMPEGLIIGEKIGRTYHDEEEISVSDHEFVPMTTNPVDLMLGNDVEPISAGELENLNIVEKRSANYGDFGKNITQKPTAVEFVHIPSEVSDVTMTMGDNELESVESNLEEIVPSGGNDRVEEHDEDRNEEDTSSKNNDHDTNEEDAPSKNNDHDLRSDNVEETNRVPSHNHNLRPRKQRSYAHLFAQMGFKAGVKNFGARAEDAVLKEFSQLNDYNCLTPRSDLTKEEKKI